MKFGALLAVVGIGFLILSSSAAASSTPREDMPEIGLPWPLPPGTFTVTSKFGTRVHPIDGVVSNHTGIDLGAASGVPVLASLDGVVEFVGTFGGYGKRVVVNHGDGVKTTYNHMSGWNVDFGQEVMSGDTIGFVGTTGKSTGPHLHFELLIDGKYIDPLEYLA